LGVGDPFQFAGGGVAQAQRVADGLSDRRLVRRNVLRSDFLLGRRLVRGGELLHTSSDVFEAVRVGILQLEF
jgi:DNA-binding IclR family transcriptional regulator